MHDTINWKQWELQSHMQEKYARTIFSLLRVIKQKPQMIFGLENNDTK